MLTVHEVYIKTAYELEVLRYRMEMVKSVMAVGCMRAEQLIRISEDCSRNREPKITVKESPLNIDRYSHENPNSQAVSRVKRAGRVMLPNRLYIMRNHSETTDKIRKAFYEVTNIPEQFRRLAPMCCMMYYFRSGKCASLDAAVEKYEHEVNRGTAPENFFCLDEYLDKSAGEKAFLCKVRDTINLKGDLVLRDIGVFFYLGCRYDGLTQLKREESLFRQKNNILADRVEMMKKGGEAVMEYIRKNPEYYYKALPGEF